MDISFCVSFARALKHSLKNERTGMGKEKGEGKEKVGEGGLGVGKKPSDTRV